MLPVLVLCGGRGSRLRAVTGDEIPKALVPVAGHPFIDHKLSNLRDAGLRDVVLSIGVGGEQIRDHVRDGSALDIGVRYSDDGPCLQGTGGAVHVALPKLSEAFWVTYGDTLLDFDVVQAERAFRSSGRQALMTVLHNRDRWGRSNALVREDRVVAYAKDCPPPGAEHIDYGMFALTRQAFAGRTWQPPFDLAVLLSALATSQRLGAYEVANRFHDIGTTDALQETEAFLLANDPPNSTL